jgi:dTDP-4-dehydrorhamnose reductase
MRVLLTGVNGTVAPKFVASAESAGHQIVGWSRHLVDPNDVGAVDGFVADVAPDAIVHMAFGAESWASQLAGIAGQRDIPFVFTSTTMVFDERPNGPYTISSPRTSTNDYGRYKIRCEDAIWDANPAAMIARLGYQIDPDGVGNNMVAHADAHNEKVGFIRASTIWIPSCAFMVDTAASLVGLIDRPERGLHHLDSNANAALSYFEIITRLSAVLGRNWTIEATDFPDHDQRLIDSPRIAPIERRLGPTGS